MANYLKATDFAVKDALLTGDPNKIVKGTEYNDEFNAIQTAVNSKSNLESPTFTGSPKAPTASLGTETTQIASTAFVANALDALVSDTGSLGLQSADNVAITGGTITGITDLTVADGGTGASTAADARTNLEVPSTTGGGASGDWNINVTGSVSTAVVNAAIAGSSVGAVGTYAILLYETNAAVAIGGTAAGSALNFVGFFSSAGGYPTPSMNLNTDTVISGTWRALGPVNNSGFGTALWLRIS